MADRPSVPTLEELEARLGELAPAIAYPPAADLSIRVARRLEAVPRRAWSGRLVDAFPVLRRSTAVAVALLLLVVAVAAAVGIVLPGLRLTFLPPGATLPPIESRSPAVPVGPAPLGARLGLGTAVELDEVPAIAGFEPLLPAALPPPDEVFVLSRRVTLVWAPRIGLPEIARTGVGLLMTQFQGVVDPGWYEKQLIEGGTTVEEVRVDGALGYWVSGRPHTLVYRDASGVFVEETRRVVGDVLVWARDDLTLRLETSLGRDETIAVAESLRPVP